MKTNYFDRPAVSNSLMGQIRKEAFGQAPLNKRSPALREGSNLHEMSLEPDKYDIRAYSGPERMKAMKMNHSLQRQAGHLMNGDKEVEFFYDFHGLQCKMKADIVNKDEGSITDLKTTRFITLEEFQASAIEYGYLRQAAWYLDAPPVRVLGITKFRIIAISKIKPHPVFIWEADRDHPWIKDGREEYAETLDYIKEQNQFNHLLINQSLHEYSKSS